MISCISGIYAGRERSGAVVIAHNGIGYGVFVDDRTKGMIGAKGEGSHVDLFTRQVFREDSQKLYGFAAVEDRDLFDAVVAIKGVGPSTALSLLSMLSGQAVLAAVNAGGAEKLLVSVPGIGNKTAKAIVEGLS